MSQQAVRALVILGMLATAGSAAAGSLSDNSSSTNAGGDADTGTVAGNIPTTT